MAADLIMPNIQHLHGYQIQQQHAQFFNAPAPPPPRPHMSHTRSYSYQQPSNHASSNIQQAAAAHHAAYSRQVSPLNTSVHGSSPSSPAVQSARRALFIPAALRPSEFEYRSSHGTRSPRTEEDGGELALHRTNSSFISLPGLNLLGSRLSRRSTGDSGKALDSDLDPDLFPRVNGQPSRQHWKPDPQSTICDDPSCTRSFSYFNRRHHCRKCGNIFCDTHSAHAIPLDQDCNYNPRGSPSRSCGYCFADFVAWKSRNNSQASSEQGSSVGTAPGDPVGTAGRGGSKTMPSSPINTGTPMSGSANLGQAKGAEAPASVPRDWNWSTF